MVTSVLQESIGGFVSLLDRNSLDLTQVKELSRGNKMSIATPGMKDHLIEVLKSHGVSEAEFEQNLETRIAPCAEYQQNLETPHPELKEYPKSGLVPYPEVDKIRTGIRLFSLRTIFGK